MFCCTDLSRQAQLHIRVFHKIISLNSATSIINDNIQNNIVTEVTTQLATNTSATNTSSVMLRQNNLLILLQPKPQ